MNRKERQRYWQRWIENHRASRANYNKQWRQENREHLIKYNREYNLYYRHKKKNKNIFVFALDKIKKMFIIK